MNNPMVGMLTMAVTLIALIVAGIGAYMMPHVPLVWQISLGIALISFVVYVATDWKSLTELFSKKTTRFGLSAMVMSLLFLAIVIFSNMIISNHDWRKDFTASKVHSLSDQSLKVLGGLQSDITLKMFTGPTQKAGFEEFLARYQYASKHMKVDYIDVFRQPELVKEYKISPTDGMNFSTIIVESGTRNSRIESIAGANDPRLEEKLTNGIIKVLKGGQRKVYFTAGHVEKPLTKAQAADGLTRIKTAMEGSRYEVQELNLPKTETLPTDAEIIILAGPKSQFFPHELKLLEEYVNKGGKLLVMLDPESSPELKDFVAKYGVDWNPKRTVFELNPLRQASAPVVPVVDVYDSSHEITKNLNAPSFFIMATSVEKAKVPPADTTLTSLYSTSPASFEQELKPGARISPQSALRKGPLSLAIAISGKVKSAPAPDAAKEKEKKPDGDKKEEAASDKPKEYRMVVTGDSDFITNQALTQGLNMDLFLNMMSWLANEEDLISIRPKPADVRDLDITEGRMRVVFLTTFLLIPFLSFATALVVRQKRRSR